MSENKQIYELVKKIAMANKASIFFSSLGFIGWAGAIIYSNKEQTRDNAVGVAGLRHEVAGVKCELGNLKDRVELNKMSSDFQREVLTHTLKDMQLEILGMKTEINGIKSDVSHISNNVDMILEEM
jgi:hypothetical protein